MSAELRPARADGLVLKDIHPFLRQGISPDHPSSRAPSAPPPASEVCRFPPSFESPQSPRTRPLPASAHPCRPDRNSPSQAPRELRGHVRLPPRRGPFFPTGGSPTADSPDCPPLGARAMS